MLMMVYGEVMIEILDNIHHIRLTVWICLRLYKAQEKGRTYSDRPVRKQLVSIPLSLFHMKTAAHKACKSCDFFFCLR